MFHSVPYFLFNSWVVYYLMVVPMLWVANYVASLFFPYNSMSNIFMIIAIFLLELFLIVGAIHFKVTHHFF